MSSDSYYNPVPYDPGMNNVQITGQPRIIDVRTTPQYKQSRLIYELREAIVRIESELHSISTILKTKTSDNDDYLALLEQLKTKRNIYTQLKKEYETQIKYFKTIS